MARKATEESKAFEKEMKGASNQAKSYAKEILENIQVERFIRVGGEIWLSLRRRAALKAKESEEKARELFKTRQSNLVWKLLLTILEYDEERLFTRSRIRTEIEEDKRKQLAAAKKNFLEEKSHLKANLTMQYEVWSFLAPLANRYSAGAKRPCCWPRGRDWRERGLKQEGVFREDKRSRGRIWGLVRWRKVCYHTENKLTSTGAKLEKQPSNWQTKRTLTKTNFQRESKEWKISRIRRKSSAGNMMPTNRCTRKSLIV